MKEQKEEEEGVSYIMEGTKLHVFTPDNDIRSACYPASHEVSSPLQIACMPHSLQNCCLTTATLLGKSLTPNLQPSWLSAV